MRSTIVWLTAKGRKRAFEDEPAGVRDDVIRAKSRMSSEDFFNLLLQHNVTRSKSLRWILWPPSQRDYKRVQEILDSDTITLPKSARAGVLPYAFNKEGRPYPDVKDYLNYLKNELVSTHCQPKNCN